MLSSKYLEVRPVQQTGANCKLVSIATVDQYWAQQKFFQPTPLHKNKTANRSLRQIAKQHGSVQGELLEIRQVPEVLRDIGYRCEIFDSINYFNYMNIIIKHINIGQPLICYFAVNSETGLPQHKFEYSPKYKQHNEHSAVIVGYNLSDTSVRILHWGSYYDVSFLDLYKSILALPAQREAEHYIKLQHDINRKYENTTADNLGAKRTITPKPHSGFHGKLIVVQEPLFNTSKPDTCWTWLLKILKAFISKIYDFLCCCNSQTEDFSNSGRNPHRV